MDKYCYNGVFFINNNVAEDKQFLLLFQSTYMINIEYHGIVGVVPRRWKTNLFQSMRGCMILTMALLTD
jgi:hypothetical protein